MPVSAAETEDRGTNGPTLDLGTHLASMCRGIGLNSRHVQLDKREVCTIFVVVDKVDKLVSGGSVINGATPSSLVI